MSEDVLHEPESVNLTAEILLHLEDGKSAVLKYSESREAFSLDLVMVPGHFRAHGIGTFLVRRLLSLADLLGKPVLTTARPIGGNSPEALERLVRYYGRLGFLTTQRGLTAVHMRRPAGGSGVGAAGR